MCRVAAVNHLLEATQIVELLKTLGAKVMVIASEVEAPDLWLKMMSVLDQLPQLRMTLVTGALAAPLSSGMRGFGESIAAQPEQPMFEARRDSTAIAALFHTGGTTGTPKIAQLSHRALVVNSWMLGEMFDMQSNDVIVCGLPLFHVNGVIVTGLAPFMNGARVLLAGRSGFRNPNLVLNFWRLVARYRVTTFAGVPTVYAALLNVPIAGADVSSLRFGICGAAPMPVEMFKRFEQATGIRLLEGFGMTETTACASVNPRDGERRVGSIGISVPYGRMKTVILDEQGQYQRDAAIDEIGVVVICGPHLTSGYLDPQHNVGLWLSGGWLNSGDLGRCDIDGYFWLVGRSKDVIIRGGHNIDPLMIEEALARHPDVELVAAVGRPDVYAGELPVAYVKLRPNARADAQELKAFARANVAERAAAPNWVECVSTMPVTAVGKIFKPILRKQAIVRTLSEHFDASGLQHSGIEVRDDATHGVVVEVCVADNVTCERVVELCAGFALRVDSRVASS